MSSKSVIAPLRSILKNSGNSSSNQDESLRNQDLASKAKKVVPRARAIDPPQPINELSTERAVKKRVGEDQRDHSGNLIRNPDSSAEPSQSESFKTSPRPEQRLRPGASLRPGSAKKNTSRPDLFNRGFNPKALTKPDSNKKLDLNLNTGSSASNVFSFGAGSSASNVTAFTSGAGSSASNVPAFTSGAGSSASNVPAFTFGAGSGTSHVPAFGSVSGANKVPSFGAVSSASPVPKVGAVSGAGPVPEVGANSASDSDSASDSNSASDSDSASDSNSASDSGSNSASDSGSASDSDSNSASDSDSASEDEFFACLEENKPKSANYQELYKEVLSKVPSIEPQKPLVQPVTDITKTDDYKWRKSLNETPKKLTPEEKTEEFDLETQTLDSSEKANIHEPCKQKLDECQKKASKALDLVQKELEKFKNEAADLRIQVKVWESEHAKYINETNVTHQNLMQEAEKKHQEAIKELERKHQLAVAELEKKHHDEIVAQIQNNNEERMKSSKLQKQLTDATKKLTELGQEVEELKQIVHDTKDTATRLEFQNADLSKHNKTLNERLDDLQKEFSACTDRETQNAIMVQFASDIRKKYESLELTAYSKILERISVIEAKAADLDACLQSHNELSVQLQDCTDFRSALFKFSEVGTKEEFEKLYTRQKIGYYHYRNTINENFIDDERITRVLSQLQPDAERIRLQKELKRAGMNDVRDYLKEQLHAQILNSFDDDTTLANLETLLEFANASYKCRPLINLLSGGIGVYRNYDQAIDAARDRADALLNILRELTSLKGTLDFDLVKDHFESLRNDIYMLYRQVTNLEPEPDKMPLNDMLVAVRDQYFNLGNHAAVLERRDAVRKKNHEGSIEAIMDPAVRDTIVALINDPVQANAAANIFELLVKLKSQYIDNHEQYGISRVENAGFAQKKWLQIIQQAFTNSQKLNELNMLYGNLPIDQLISRIRVQIDATNYIENHFRTRLEMDPQDNSEDYRQYIGRIITGSLEMAQHYHTMDNSLQEAFRGKGFPRPAPTPESVVQSYANSADWVQYIHKQNWFRQHEHSASFNGLPYSYIRALGELGNMIVGAGEELRNDNVIVLNFSPIDIYTLFGEIITKLRERKAIRNEENVPAVPSKKLRPETESHLDL